MILVVTESSVWGESVGIALEEEGFAVRLDLSREGVFEPLRFDLAIVDMENTFRAPDAAILSLRDATDAPILAVTPALVREAVSLTAYSSGADQCVALTTRPRELVARVRALLRRHPPSTGGEPHTEIRVAGVLDLDASRRSVVVDGEEIPLSARECEILVSLLRRPGRVVPRDELMSTTPAEDGESTLDAVMRRLRTKLESVDQRRRIVAVRGVGFRFDAGG